tara:strand:- start:4494 stop:4763 length:270 start_codon:yes stop_codon:yes gene_type:complete
MKIFIYKFVIVLIGTFLLFELTIGSKIKYYERNFIAFFSKGQIETIKMKLREEMNTAVEKEVYLDPEDAKLISDFIKKIQKELENNETQ